MTFTEQINPLLAEIVGRCEILNKRATGLESRRSERTERSAAIFSYDSLSLAKLSSMRSANESDYIHIHSFHD